MDDAEVAMTVKQLIIKLQHPPCNRIAAARIEFADGSIYAVSPGTRRNIIAAAPRWKLAGQPKPDRAKLRLR